MFWGCTFTSMCWGHPRIPEPWGSQPHRPCCRDPRGPCLSVPLVREPHGRRGPHHLLWSSSERTPHQRKPLSEDHAWAQCPAIQSPGWVGGGGQPSSGYGACGAQRGAPRAQERPQQGVTEQVGNRTTWLQKKAGVFTPWVLLGGRGPSRQGGPHLAGRTVDQQTCTLRVKPRTEEDHRRLCQRMSQLPGTQRDLRNPPNHP